MSLCIGARVKDGYIIAVDGRSSIVVDGVGYCVEENTAKYAVRDNKLYVVFGQGDVVAAFIKCLNIYQSKTIDEAFEEVLSEERKKFYLSGNNQEMLVGAFEINIANKQIYEAYFYKDGSGSMSVAMGDYFAFGAKEKEAASIISNSPRGSNIFDVFINVFDSLNSYDVGGIWTLFHATIGGVKPLGRYENDDKNILYAPKELIDKIDKTSRYLSSLNIYAPNIHAGEFHGGKYKGLGAIDKDGNIIEHEAEFYGASYFDAHGTVRLEIGSDDTEIYGDLTLTREADGTVVFKIYDDVYETSLIREGKCFLRTTGGTTWTGGKWDFSNSEVAGLNVTATFG